MQWQAAVEHPPGLVAIAPQATWSSFYRNLYLGGAVRLSLISSWLAGNTPKPEGVQPADMNEALLRLPLSDVDKAIGWPMPWLDAYLTHPEPNGFWTRLDLTDELPNLKMPALHVVGYYDFFSRESVGNFMIMQQARDPQTRKAQRLVLGPWDHGTEPDRHLPCRLLQRRVEERNAGDFSTHRPGRGQRFAAGEYCQRHGNRKKLEVRS